MDDEYVFGDFTPQHSPVLARGKVSPSNTPHEGSVPSSSFAQFLPSYANAMESNEAPDQLNTVMAGGAGIAGAASAVAAEPNALAMPPWSVGPQDPPGFSAGPNDFGHGRQPFMNGMANAHWIGNGNGNVYDNGYGHPLPFPPQPHGAWPPVGPQAWLPNLHPPTFFQHGPMGQPFADQAFLPAAPLPAAPYMLPPHIPGGMDPIYPPFSSAAPENWHGRQQQPQTAYNNNDDNINNKLFNQPSAGPRGTTSIEALEAKAAAAAKDEQKVLTSTQPGQSWVTDLSDWRTKGAADAVKTGQQRGFVSGASQSVVSAFRGGAAAFVPHGFEKQQQQQQQQQQQGQVASSVRHHKVFRPMTAVMNAGSRRELSGEERALRVRLGISENYQGNPNNPKNQSADIPDEENCALFLTNLPAHCTYAELLGAIQIIRPGRVWSSYINRPLGKEHGQNSGTGKTTPFKDSSKPLSHRTSAAKVIFYHPCEAQRLLQVARAGEFRIGGRCITVKLNRHRTAAQGYNNPTSRVVLIEGPARIVDEEWLGRLFGLYFEYDTDGVRILVDVIGWRVLEWRFSSMRAQAHSAYQLLESLYPGIVEVTWVEDPCAGYLRMPDQFQPAAGGMAGGRSQTEIKDQPEDDAEAGFSQATTVGSVSVPTEDGQQINSEAAGEDTKG
ncbi:hypothetical protein BD289DRAFT_481102 [Coniella lustricola]|uniref:Uncharacterized protein n=1 Tax=Coniella lustricola TaxID=2025994 RepID=A0A2T3ADI2_9PEZI|nr:hypothetical protein BD289DRAFT_481102 [Coniella lustricola]